MFGQIINGLATSAAKVAFLLVIGTCCLGFLLGKLPVTEFMAVVTAATTFFFSYKGQDNSKYAGK